MKTKEAVIPGNAYSQAMPAPLITIDLPGIIYRCNTEAEKMFGVQPGTLLRQNIKDLVKFEESNSFENEILPALRLQGNIRLQCSLKNNENAFYTLHFISLLNTENELIGITLTFSVESETTP